MHKISENYYVPDPNNNWDLLLLLIYNVLKKIRLHSLIKPTIEEISKGTGETEKVKEIDDDDLTGYR